MEVFSGNERGVEERNAYPGGGAGETFILRVERTMESYAGRRHGKR